MKETLHENQYTSLLFIAQFCLETNFFNQKVVFIWLLRLMSVSMDRNKTVPLNEPQILILFSLQLSVHKVVYLEQ